VVRRTVAIVIGFVGALAMPAAAQPGVFGGCPRSKLRDVMDAGAVVEDFVVSIDQDGTRLATAVLRRCKPLPVRGGHARGLPRCTDEGDNTPALSLAPSPELRGKLRRAPGDYHWRAVEIYAGRRRIVRWKSEYPVDCVGRIFLSADRRTVIVEVTRSKKFFMSEDEAIMVLPLRLSRPLR
jgi:hypothetical protein